MKFNNFLALFFLVTVSMSYVKQISKNDATFSFSTKHLSNDKNQIEIMGLLFNHNSDTLYFLSSSCDGTQYSLQFDSTKFTMNPRLDCFTSWPVIQKIPPNKSFAFSSYFKLKSNENKIKLGFDLYVIPKAFDLKSVKLRQIYNRKNTFKNIIWAEEQQIK
jgi:hypothetical protein